VGLSREHAARLEDALRSPEVGELTAMLFKLRRRLVVDPPPVRLIERAGRLGLLEEAPLRLTTLGERVSDSMAEYGYWKERGKRHHWSEEIDALRVENLRGKHILEVGCGAGVNLLSLQRHAEVVGVDVEPLYLEFVELLARLECVHTPRVVCALAEQLPFEDASFDIALFHGSLQYMQIEDAMREAARVLRPGGRIIAIQSDIAQALGIRARHRGWTLVQPGILLREARSAVGMAVYPWVGRLLVKPFAPVHVTRRRARRWLSSAGLHVNSGASCEVANEVCYVADKPARD
jgi:ubiquinone/menaquinone biosynthesis C-methylase UbiE